MPARRQRKRRQLLADTAMVTAEHRRLLASLVVVGFRLPRCLAARAAYTRVVLSPQQPRQPLHRPGELG